VPAGQVPADTPALLEELVAGAWMLPWLALAGLPGWAQALVEVLELVLLPAGQV